MSVTETQAVITITDQAAAKVKDLLSQEDNKELALRVGVRPGGCSGYTYEMYFDSEVGENDMSFEQQGVKLIVDRDSAPLIQGAILEYKDALVGAGFTINNPNAKRSCGCGSSFS